MAVRARRLFGPVGIDPFPVDPVFTVPAGRTAVVRGLTAQNVATTAQDLFVFVRIGANDLALWFPTLAAREFRAYPAYLALNPGDGLVAASSSALAEVTLIGSGSLLLGIPE